MSHRILSRSLLALVSLLAFGAGCGGAVASTAETENPAPGPKTASAAAATLFAHFDDSPSAILLGRDYMYVATKTSLISGVRTENGALWAVSKATGARHQLFLDRFGAAPVSLARSGNEILLAMSDGRVLALPENGGDSRIAARVQGTPIQVVATKSDALLRIAEDPSLLVTVGLGDGSVRTRFTPDAQLVSLAAAEDNVYIGMKTAAGGRVTRLVVGAATAEQERTIELPAAPCGMSAAPAGLVLTDGSTTLRYWDGGAAPASFVSDLPSTCTLATSQDRVFWAGTSPKVRASNGGSGGTVLLSRMIAPAVTQGAAGSGAADWITTDLDSIAQAESDETNVYVLTTEDIVRVARPAAQ